MIRLVVANGCSFTRGEELTDPPTQAWPAILGVQLAVPSVNLGRDGSSNRQMVRTTVARLSGICAEWDVRPEQVLVVHAWTTSLRHEYLAAEEPVQFTAGLPRHPVEHRWQQIGPWRLDEHHKPTRAFYDHLWSEEGQLINLFLDWVMLDRYLGHEGYRACYAFAIAPPQQLPESVQPFAHQLDPAAVWGGIPHAPGHSMVEMTAGLPRGPRTHPLAEGHELIALRLAQWLTEPTGALARE